MKINDILFLVAAIIVWLYSSYRTYQKQAAEKAKTVISKLPPESDPVKPVVRQIVTVKRKLEPKLKPERIKSKYEKVQATKEPVSLENITSDIHQGIAPFHGYEKEQTVNNIQSMEVKTSSSSNYIEELIDEIHSGNTDWRKAIILSELIRPVYFEEKKSSQI